MTMVEAFVLIQVHVGSAWSVARRIVGLDGVRSVDVVTGPYDLIVRVEGTSMDELGKLVLRPIQAVEGVTRTLTCPTLHRE
jgi:DNA-binding Lrp family transcriptional regulator